MKEFTNEEVEARIAVCDQLLATVAGQDELEESIRAQQQELRAELARREDVPPPVVIGLKTAYTDAVLPGGM